MQRETPLAAAAVVVVAVALLVAALVPGVLADPVDERLRDPGPVRVTDLPISTASVGGDAATLHVEANLQHYGNPTPNVTVLFRAVDSDSGLVETTQTVDVGDVSGEREVTASANLTVEREGGYRIETIVYADGQRIDSGSRTVSGLEALVPAYAQTDVRFADSSALQPVSVSIEQADAGENRTRLALTAALTNEGGNVSENLSVTFVLRQAASNVVAARESVSVGQIRPGRTATAETTVAVPGDYNYYVDAVLWKDDVLVDSAQSVANLDPTETISANQTRRDVEFDASDFESGGRDEPNATPGGTASADAPGFGVLAGVLALLASALLARRWSA